MVTNLLDLAFFYLAARVYYALRKTLKAFKFESCPRGDFSSIFIKAITSNQSVIMMGHKIKPVIQSAKVILAVPWESRIVYLNVKYITSLYSFNIS